MSKKVLGAAGAIEGPKRYTGGPNKPSASTQVWSGQKADVLAKVADVVAAGGEWDIDEVGPTATLRASFPYLASGDPTTDALVDQWELLPGETEKDLLEADLAVINSLTEDEKRKIRDAINNPTPGVSPSLTTSGAIDIYLLMLNGMRSVKMFAPVLRHTLTVSNVYEVAASTTNVKRIISSATLAVDLPTGFLIAINGAPFTTASNRTGYVYGWFKKFPTLNAAAGSRLQIVQEWEFGLWPTAIYGTAL